MAVRLLQGKQIATASWAQNAVTASYATSASYTATASYAPNYVPYTGATQEVDLGNNPIKTTNVRFVSPDYDNTIELNEGPLVMISEDINSGDSNLIQITIDSTSSRKRVYAPGFIGDYVEAPSITGSLFGTASWAQNSSTASFALTSSFVNPLTQDVYITGSLNVTGSTTQIGNNNLLGNTVLSGSIIISGSTTVPSTPSIKVYGDMETDGVIKFMPVSKNIDTSISASYIFVSGSTDDLYFSQNGGGYNNVTRLRWLEGNLYTGLLHGGRIVSASTTTFTIEAGSGIIVELNASLVDDPYPTIKEVKWDDIVGVPLTYRTTDVQTFIGLDENANVIQQTDPWYNGQYNTSLSLGTVLHQNFSTINGTISYPNVAYGYKQRTYDFIKAFGPLKLSGFNIVPTGSLGLNVGSGTAFAEGRNYQTDPNNPSYVTDAGTAVSKIFRYYSSGSAFVQDTNGGAGYTTLDIERYNNNGVLTNIPNNKYSIQRIFWYPNSVTRAIVAYYGTTYYDTIDSAAANINYEEFRETENTKQNAIYLGAIVIQEGTDFTDTDYSILEAGIFRNVGGAGGGGTVPTTLLSGLADTTIAGPTNGQPLVYNDITAKWENNSQLIANVTGSLFGTSSFAQTASYAPNYIEKSVGPTYTTNAILTVTQAEYDAIDPKDSTTLYFIV